MPKTAIVQARIQPDLKKEADQIFSEIGLNPTTAITLFYTQVVRQRGLPFDLKIPNDGRLEAINEEQDAEFQKNTHAYAGVDDLFTALKSE